MSKLSGANRLRPPHLRLVYGGAKSPVLRSELRLPEARRAVTAACVGIAILLLSLLATLGVLAALAAHGQVGRVPRVALLGLVAGAGLLAFGIVLIVRALHHVLRMERRAGAGREKMDARGRV